MMKYLQVPVYLYSIYYCSSLSVHMSRTGELKPQHKGPEVNKNYLYTFLNTWVLFSSLKRICITVLKMYFLNNSFGHPDFTHVTKPNLRLHAFYNLSFSASTRTILCTSFGRLSKETSFYKSVI